MRAGAHRVARFPEVPFPLSADAVSTGAALLLPEARLRHRFPATAWMRRCHQCDMYFLYLVRVGLFCWC